MPTNIKTIFANLGDKTEPLQSDPTGKVNFSDGYTQAYEQALNAGNPDARAVERGIMNYMFNMITGNLKFSQDHGNNLWFADQSGGYPMHAIVCKLVGTKYLIYRSLIDANTSDPATATASWELQNTQASILANVAMPVGGGQTATGTITVATSFNNLTNGTWIFAQDAIAAASPSAPNGNLTGRGQLESRSWVVSGSTQVVQAYLDVQGFIWTRSGSAGTWQAWQKSTTDQSVQQGQTNYSVMTGSVNVYSVALTPTPTQISSGMQLILRNNAVSNTGPTTLTVNGFGPWPIYNINGNPLHGSEIPANSTIELVKRTDNAWALMLSHAGSAQLQNMELQYALMPVGAPIAWPSATIPTGYLAMNGQAISAVTYPLLYALYGNTLMDMRAMFIRGADTGRGVDPGRAVLSYQDTANLGHSHTGNTASAGNHSHTAGTDSNGAHTHVVTGLTDANGTHSHGASADNQGNHQHTFPLTDDTNGTGRADGGTAAKQDGSQTTDAAGLHAHNITIANGGNHQHSLTMTSQGAGAHTHTVTVNAAGAHTHSFTTDGSGTTESRPKNVAYTYIVRAG